jgi:hypothetical protein
LFDEAKQSLEHKKFDVCGKFVALVAAIALARSAFPKGLEFPRKPAETVPLLAGIETP